MININYSNRLEVLPTQSSLDENNKRYMKNVSSCMSEKKSYTKLFLDLDLDLEYR